MNRILLLTPDVLLKRKVIRTAKEDSALIQTASEPVFAWRLLKEYAFDLVIIDYQLHEESGLSFYKAIRQMGFSLPILMIGEGAFDEFMLKDLSPDHYDYLLKPFSSKELQRKCHELTILNRYSSKLLEIGC
jgi:DNA-binding response OmpR family regulator